MIRLDETLEELVEARRGYKYLSSDGVSPYQGHQYDLTFRGVIKDILNDDPDEDCGRGLHLATVRWIIDNCMGPNGVIVEFSIPQGAKICVPKQSDGKFRTNMVCIVSVTPVMDVFPALAGLLERLANYKPANPITATVLPDVAAIRRGMASVGDSVRASVWASVRASVWASLGASVWDSVGAPVRDSVWASVWDSVGASVRDSVWASVRDSVRASVGESVWDCSYLCGYYAIVKFLSLDYRHPVFDLIDLGVMVVPQGDSYFVFGKDGILLGRVGNND